MALPKDFAKRKLVRLASVREWDATTENIIDKIEARIPPKQTEADDEGEQSEPYPLTVAVGVDTWVLPHEATILEKFPLPYGLAWVEISKTEEERARKALVENAELAGVPLTGTGVITNTPTSIGSPMPEENSLGDAGSVTVPTVTIPPVTTTPTTTTTTTPSAPSASSTPPKSTTGSGQ